MRRARGRGAMHYQALPTTAKDFEKVYSLVKLNFLVEYLLDNGSKSRNDASVRMNAVTVFWIYIIAALKNLSDMSHKEFDKQSLLVTERLTSFSLPHILQLIAQYN